MTGPTYWQGHDQGSEWKSVCDLGNLGERGSSGSTQGFSVNPSGFLKPRVLRFRLSVGPAQGVSRRLPRGGRWVGHVGLRVPGPGRVGLEALGIGRAETLNSLGGRPARGPRVVWPHIRPRGASAAGTRHGVSARRPALALRVGTT